MPQITIEVSQQELDTLTLAAKIRGNVDEANFPIWEQFYAPWHSDAYGQVQRTAGSIISDNPELSAQLMTMLQASING